jgi:F0F1-type ATP synthase epsilon subunit
VSDGLHIIIRTPHQVVVDERVVAVRVPTESGQVGLRPRQEAVILVVEPGLIILRRDAVLRFVATAGGLLEGDRETSILYSPFAVAGDGQEEVMAALEQVLAMPDSELAARRRLAELEQHILQELRSRAPVGRAEGAHG